VRLEVRNERRVSAVLPVYIRRLGSYQVAEKVRPGNVSPSGAQLVTRRRWQPEHRRAVAVMVGRRQHLASVVYCKAVSGQRFCVGLRFAESLDGWWAGLSIEAQNEAEPKALTVAWACGR
jgi:hypothetical protein